MKLLTLWDIGVILRRIVPGTYLLMALYIGIMGSKTRRNIGYITLFGLFGAACYMVLNQPRYTWFPVWVVKTDWMMIALIGLLAIAIVTFMLAVEVDDIDNPKEVFGHYATMIRTGKMPKQNPGEETNDNDR